MIAPITTFLVLGLGFGVQACQAKQTTKRAAKWQPEVGAPWQIVLNGAIDLSKASSLTPDVGIYDLDLYENDAKTFSTLQSMGKKVICYFSAGSYEDWRPDAGDFLDKDLGAELDGWEGENWLDLNSDNVRQIMAKRIKMASDKGCDAIDPDNVDGFDNENGIGLTSEDTVSFVKFLSAEAAKYNMATGLKNAGDIVDQLIDDVDFCVNEQCNEYSEYKECTTFSQFIKNDKPVFHIEYPDGTPGNVSGGDAKSICNSEGTDSFSTVIKTMDLDGWVQYCDGETYETQ